MLLIVVSTLKISVGAHSGQGQNCEHVKISCCLKRVFWAIDSHPSKTVIDMSRMIVL